MFRLDAVICIDQIWGVHLSVTEIVLQLILCIYVHYILIEMFQYQQLVYLHV